MSKLNIKIQRGRYPISDEETLKELSAVFLDSKVLADDEVVLPIGRHRDLSCNYHDKLRIVNGHVCQYHLEAFDPWCWQKCETEGVIKKLRPVFNAAYQHRKDFTPIKVAAGKIVKQAHLFAQVIP